MPLKCCQFVTTGLQKAPDVIRHYASVSQGISDNSGHNDHSVFTVGEWHTGADGISTNIIMLFAVHKYPEAEQKIEFLFQIHNKLWKSNHYFETVTKVDLVQYDIGTLDFFFLHDLACHPGRNDVRLSQQYVVVAIKRNAGSFGELGVTERKLFCRISLAAMEGEMDWANPF